MFSDREGEAGCEEEKLEGESGTNRETEAATETQQEGDEVQTQFNLPVHCSGIAQSVHEHLLPESAHLSYLGW